MVAGLLVAGVVLVVVLLWAKWRGAAGGSAVVAGRDDVRLGVRPGGAEGAGRRVADQCCGAVSRAAAVVAAGAQPARANRQCGGGRPVQHAVDDVHVLHGAGGGHLAPVGVSTAAALAYWLGNPLLNPAVLVFLVFVAPWQWTATRLVVGVLIVVGGSALVARLVEGRPAEGAAPTAWLSGGRRPRPTARRVSGQRGEVVDA
jgi:hypothetical protein